MNRIPAILVYVSVAVFAAGMGWRIWTWLRAPVPLKIVLTPGPKTTIGVLRRLAGEALLFRSLFADRPLWIFAWLFHFSLVLLAIGHFAGLVTPTLSQRWLGLDSEHFHVFAQVTGGLIGILALAALLFLLVRRVMAERARYVSTPADYAALALLLLVILTGNQLRFLSDLDVVQVQRFVSGLIRFHLGAPPANTVFITHLLLVCALLAYIPFSKLVHFGGLAFSPTLNQRNNPRSVRHS
jgi:nitrate reductase gamma subunit